MRWRGYHVAKGGRGCLPDDGTAVLMTADFDRAAALLPEDACLLEVEAAFASVGSLDWLIADLARPGDPGVLGYTRAEIRAIALHARTSPARAACAGAFGGGFNRAVIGEAKARGHDALKISAEPAWVIALAPAALRVVGRLEPGGDGAEAALTRARA